MCAHACRGAHRMQARTAWFRQPVKRCKHVARQRAPVMRRVSTSSRSSRWLPPTSSPTCRRHCRRRSNVVTSDKAVQGVPPGSNVLGEHQKMRGTSTATRQKCPSTAHVRSSPWAPAHPWPPPSCCRRSAACRRPAGAGLWLVESLSTPQAQLPCPLGRCRLLMPPFLLQWPLPPAFL